MAKKKMSIDIETSTLQGVHDMVIVDYPNKTKQVVDIKTHKDIYSHIADAMKYGTSTMMIAQPRAMGKSFALGALYGAGKSTWKTIYQLYEEMQHEKLAKSSELGSILYGKD